MLKKISKILLWSLFFSLIAWVIFSSKTYALDYKYNNLKVTATISEDSSMHIDEDYEAFFYVPKHWIIRKIYRNFTSWWKRFHTDISNIDVEWRNFETDEYDGEITVKIWDYYIELTWKQDYHISFDVYWLIRNFSWSWFAELYWNLVWSQYDTEFDKVSAEIILPKAYTWFKNWDILIATKNEKYTAEDFPWVIDWSQWDRIIIEYDKWLTVKQWIKLWMRFPKDYFTFDHEKQASLIWSIGQEYQSKSSSSSSAGSVVKLLLIIIIGVVIYFVRKNEDWINLKEWKLTWKYAKQFPVIVQYAPPKWINSAEAWVLIHRWITHKDMLSLIYKWAAEGLIKLATKTWEEENEGIQITKLKDIPWDAPEYEREFFNEITPARINDSIWYENFQWKLKDISKIEEYWVEKWWFYPRKEYHIQDTLRVVIWICFITVFASFVLAIVYKIDFFGWMIWISFFVTWALIFFWSIIAVLLEKYLNRLRLTESWAALVSHLVWYRQFLATCDEGPLRTCLAQDPLFFNKVLPYAVAFWLDTEFIKKMTPILNESNINTKWCDWTMDDILLISSVFESSEPYVSSSYRSSFSDSSYDSDSWFDSWSSFDHDFDSDSWGWCDWWWSSW